MKRRIYSEALIRKAEEGLIEFVKVLIKAGADVNFGTTLEQVMVEQL